MSPKGAGFLHARPEHQERVDAAIVSWGYAEGRGFQERIEMQGTQYRMRSATRRSATGTPSESAAARSRARPARGYAISWALSLSRPT